MKLLYSYQNYLSTYSESTQKVYFECVKLYFKYLNEVYGKVNPIIICNVDQSDIYNYLAYMDNLSRNSRKNRIYAIKNFYKFLQIDGLFDDIKLFGEERLPNYFTLSECKKLIDFYPEGRNKLIMRIFLTTGIRLSELAGIRKDDIDFKNHTIKIMCKGRVERKIIVNKKVLDSIKRLDPGDKLFDISKSQIRYIVKKAEKELGLQGSVHTLRHSFATLSLIEHNDIRLVMELLGHKNIISTQRYTHVHSRQIMDAMNKHPLANYGGVKWN